MNRRAVGIRSAQTVLRVANPSLKIDGLWGPVSAATYSSAPTSVRAAAKSVLSLNGIDINTLPVGGPIVESAEVQSAIAKAAQVTGISSAVLTEIARTESGFNPLAVNGTSKGLFQNQLGAWENAAQYVALPPYAQAWMNPYDSALAAAGYMLYNQAELKRLRLTDTLTPAMLYLAHQQGAAGFLELWNASKGIETTHYVTPAHMLRNPPPDGEGPTTNKSQFYRRWIAVMNKRFGS